MRSVFAELILHFLDGFTFHDQIEGPQLVASAETTVNRYQQKEVCEHVRPHGGSPSCLGIENEGVEENIVHQQLLQGTFQLPFPMSFPFGTGNMYKM